MAFSGRMEGLPPPGNGKNISQSQKLILSRWFSSFLKICDRFLEATSKGYEKLYTSPKKLTIENPPFEDVFPIEHGDFPMSYEFSGV